MITNKEQQIEFELKDEYSVAYSDFESVDWQEENTYDAMLPSDNNEYLICDEMKQSEVNSEGGNSTEVNSFEDAFDSTSFNKENFADTKKFKCKTCRKEFSSAKKMQYHRKQFPKGEKCNVPSTKGRSKYSEEGRLERRKVSRSVHG